MQGSPVVLSQGRAAASASRSLQPHPPLTTFFSLIPGTKYLLNQLLLCTPYFLVFERWDAAKILTVALLMPSVPLCRLHSTASS